MLSGPNDLEAFACLIAFLVLSEVKLGSPLLERDFILRVRIRAVLDDECLTMEVNCLLNLVAIFLASETILPLKVMGWINCFCLCLILVFSQLCRRLYLPLFLFLPRALFFVFLVFFCWDYVLCHID